jgi:AbrB family looped-hinge helix DNA binding protein
MSHSYRVVVGDRGRLVLPSPIRSQLDLKSGSQLLLDAEPDGTLRLRPYRSIAEQARGLFADPEAGSLVDELLSDRRDAGGA